MKRANVNGRIKMKKWPFVMGAIMLLLIFGWIQLLKQAGNMMPLPKTVKAEQGEIVSTIIGTGNLLYADKENMEAPSALSYTEILVDEGDSVAEGDIIAKIDPDAIQRRIVEIQTEIEAVDTEIRTEKNKENTLYVASAFEGRIHKVYAERWESVQSVMKEHGALALMSVDGRMKVVTEHKLGILPGGSYTAVLPDETEREALAIAQADGSAAITFSDWEVEIGSEIKIKNGEGEIICEGTAEIYEPIKLTALSGRIDEIYVNEKDYVNSGTSVFYITNISPSEQYPELFTKREDLVTEWQTLLKLAETDTLTAEFSGVISDLYIKEGNGTQTETADVQGMYSEAQAQQGAKSETTEKAGYMTDVLKYYPDDEMKLEINIDELDVLQIEENQPVEIFFESMKNEVFSGEIEDISKDAAITANGAAQYKATISIDKDERMLFGMSATATVTIEKKEDVLLIPIEALQEAGDEVFVYTEFDEKNNELSGKTAVKTGISDGTDVEITEGLSEGQNVYYYPKESQTTGIMGGGRRTQNNDDIREV
jgi:hypothetical protein